MKKILTIFIPIFLVTAVLVAQNPSLSLPPVSPAIPLVETPGGGLPSITLPPTEPDVTEPTFEDFTGGWNTEDFPDNIEDKDALEIENFIWSKMGRLEPRPGYAFYNDTEIESGKRIWGLYRHYKRDRRSVLYVGTADSLYVDTSQAQSGSFLTADSIGYTDNEEFFDFESFRNYCIVVHRGDTARILDELDIVTPTFGFVDSFEQEWCAEPFSACSSIVCGKDVDWIPNQWAGYWLSLDVNPRDDAEGPTNIAACARMPRLILGNSENEIYLPSILGVLEGNYGQRYITGLFDYDDVVDTIIISSLDVSICGLEIIPTDWSTADTLWHTGTNVLRMITGEASGSEGDIIAISQVGSDSALYVSEVSFDYDDLAVGDTGLILRQNFWQAEFVKAHKNRLFMVVRNNWPESGQFIVFSEYNSVTHFDYNNYFFVRTDDGDKVTQLATFYQDQLGYKDESKDGLIIFKENSIYKLTFINENNYYLTQVVEGVGCMAGQTVRVIEGKYMLFLHSTGVYAFDGRTITLLTKKIDSEIENIERSPDHDECAAGYDNRHYYLSCPSMTGDQTLTGDFIVTWPFTGGLWHHIIDEEGNESGSDEEDCLTATGNYHDVATDDDGNYVLLWKAANSSHYDLFLTRFDAAGDTASGATIQLNDDADDVKSGEIGVTMNNEGLIMACWTSTNDGSLDIRCQAADYDSSGSLTKVGSNFYVNNDAGGGGSQFGFGGVDMNEHGVAVVVWTDYREASEANHEIYAQIYTWPDDTSGTNFRVNNAWCWNPETHVCDTCYTPDAGPSGNCLDADQQAHVAVNETHFVATWISQRGVGTWAIWKRLFEIDGTPVDAKMVQVDDAPAGATMTDPYVAISSSGRHVVAWNYSTGLGTYDAAVRQYEQTGVAKGGVQKANSGGAISTECQAAVAINSNDVFVVTWYDSRYNAATIFARAYGWTGALGDDFLLNDEDTTTSVGSSGPEIDVKYDTLGGGDRYALAWNIDYGGWSKMVNYAAGLYAPQKGLADTINLIFSDPANRAYVYEYGKVFQDTGQDISVMFKSKAFDFNSIANQKRFNRFFMTYYLSAGSFDLTFYTNFGNTAQYTDQVSDAGGYRYVRVPLDWNCRGRNFSYKIESTDDLRIDKIRLRLKVEED